MFFSHFLKKLFIQHLIHYSQSVSCDLFLGRMHAPRTSRLRPACTRVRTPNLKWSHFAPRPAPFGKIIFFSNFSIFFQKFFNIFMV